MCFAHLATSAKSPWEKIGETNLPFLLKERMMALQSEVRRSPEGAWKSPRAPTARHPQEDPDPDNATAGWEPQMSEEPLDYNNDSN
jgi:hypothetical protein